MLLPFVFQQFFSVWSVLRLVDEVHQHFLEEFEWYALHLQIQPEKILSLKTCQIFTNILE